MLECANLALVQLLRKAGLSARSDAEDQRVRVSGAVFGWKCKS